MEALAAALRAYGLALCAAITSCRDLHSLLTLLALAAADLLCEEQPAQPSNDVPEAPGEQELAARRRSLAAAAAEAAATSEQRRALFYASSAYQDVAETLLTVVAPDWLPRCTPEQRRALFDRWFSGAPAHALLMALTSHLAAVQPSSSTARAGRALVTAVSADEAAAMLAARFAAPGYTGVRELLRHVQQAAATAAGAGGAADAAERLEGGLAAALASVPERAAGVGAPVLEPAAFVPAVADQLAGVLAELTQQAAAAATPPDPVEPATSVAAAGEAASTTFAADVLGRFCRRGHQQVVILELLDHKPLLTGGYKAILHIHSIVEECEVTKLRACPSGQLVP